MQLKLLASSLALLSAVYAQDGERPSLTDALSGSEDLSSLAALVTADPELLAALGSATNITIFAPSNAAFEEALQDPAIAALAADPALIRGVLQYHVVAGEYAAASVPETKTFVPTLLNDTSLTNVTGGQVVGVRRSGESVTVFSGLGANSSVTTADVFFQGGVVHVIDSVLTVPANISTTATAAGLTSLAEALVATELLSTVEGLADITVFAPNNAAFEAVANVTAELSTEELASILTYHVVQGTVGYSSVLSDGLELETVNGATVTITIDGDSVLVNDIPVVIADVLVSNGVVHVIEGVLIPEESEQPEETEGTATATATDGSSPSSTAPVQEASVAAAPPMATIGVAALFGAGAALLNM